MGSIAKVKGLIVASHPNHFGINEIGAKAVLAKSKGKFNTKIRAISSICPGKTKAIPRLIAVTPKTKRIKVSATIKSPKRVGHPYPKKPAVTMIARL